MFRQGGAEPPSPQPPVTVQELADRFTRLVKSGKGHLTVWAVIPDADGTTALYPVPDLTIVATPSNASWTQPTETLTPPPQMPAPRGRSEYRSRLPHSSRVEALGLNSERYEKVLGVLHRAYPRWVRFQEIKAECNFPVHESDTYDRPHSIISDALNRLKQRGYIEWRPITDSESGK